MSITEQEFAELKLRNEELAAALTNSNKMRAALDSDFESRVQQEAERIASDAAEQRKVVDASLAAERQSRTLRKPASYAEYASQDVGTRAKLLALYGGESLVAELLSQKRRADASAAHDAQVAKVKAHDKRVQ